MIVLPLLFSNDIANVELLVVDNSKMDITLKKDDICIHFDYH